MIQPLDLPLVALMRDFAREGRTPSAVYRELRRRIGQDAHILVLIAYFREAFSLSLQDAKPLAAFTRNDARDIEDEGRLDQLLGDAIRRNRPAWDKPESDAA